MGLFGCKSVFIELDLFFKLFFVALSFLSTVDCFKTGLSLILCSCPVVLVLDFVLFFESCDLLYWLDGCCFCYFDLGGKMLFLTSSRGSELFQASWLLFRVLVHRLLLEVELMQQLLSCCSVLFCLCFLCAERHRYIHWQTMKVSMASQGLLLLLGDQIEVLLLCFLLKVLLLVHQLRNDVHFLK